MAYSVFPAPASGPTLSEITTAGTAAGWGLTGGDNWTLISTLLANSSATLSFTGLTGYKTYKMVFDGWGSGTARSTKIRLNNLSALQYNSGGMFSDINNAYATQLVSQDGMFLFASNTSITLNGTITIPQANISGTKNVDFDVMGSNSAGSPYGFKGVGSYLTLIDPINRIDIISSGTWTGGRVSLYGGN